MGFLFFMGLVVVLRPSVIRLCKNLLALFQLLPAVILGRPGETSWKNLYKRLFVAISAMI